jgi:hypothetical protein
MLQPRAGIRRVEVGVLNDRLLKADDAVVVAGVEVQVRAHCGHPVPQVVLEEFGQVLPVEAEEDAAAEPEAVK